MNQAEMKQRESPTDLIGNGAPRPTPVSSTREPSMRDGTDIRLGSCRHANRGETSHTCTHAIKPHNLLNLA